jgi:hypothetical protein
VCTFPPYLPQTQTIEFVYNRRDSSSEIRALKCNLFIGYARISDSAVGIATRLRAGRPGVRVQLGASDRPCGPPSLLFNVYRGSFPRLKWPGCEVEH